VSDPTSLHVIEADGVVSVVAHGEVVIRLDGAIPPESVAAIVRLARELEAVRAKLRVAEDAATVGLVAAIVAHDARNMLVAMLVAADVLRARGDADAESVEILADGCWRMAAMLRRLTSLGQRGQPRDVDVNAVIAELSPTLHALVRDRVQLTMQLDSSLPHVSIDPADLERALLNLVANARDASAADGEVIISTSARDGWLIVEVADHGEGMDAATRARALEPFFTTKPEGVGTGLGLASVARFVREVGGELELDSERDRGTRVRMRIPAARDYGSNR
jgi:signal transduction histidine kinase